MKTQNNKLNFNSKAIIDLNDYNLSKIEGGSSPACFTIGYMIMRDILNEF